MSMPQHFYTIAWAGWFVYFAIVEWIAIRDPDQGDTLSEYVWYAMFEGGDRATFTPRPVIFYLLAGFLVWLVVHFVFQGRWG